MVINSLSNFKSQSPNFELAWHAPWQTEVGQLIERFLNGETNAREMFTSSKTLGRITENSDTVKGKR